MRKLFIVLFSFLSATAWADCAQPNVRLVAFASEEVAVSTVAVGLTAATYNPTNCTANNSCAIAAVISIKSNDINWLASGTAPTSVIGLLASSGGFLSEVCAADLPKFKAIRVSADAVLGVQYYRAGN